MTGREELAGFAVHDFCPVFATASTSQDVYLHSLDQEEPEGGSAGGGGWAGRGRVIGHVRSQASRSTEPAIGQTIMAYHPHRPMLAYVGLNGAVSLLESDVVSRRRRDGATRSSGTFGF